MKHWHYKAAPARPFDAAQGERPHAAMGWISAYAEMTEKGGWERGGRGVGSAGGVEAFGGVAQGFGELGDLP